jgi:selenocysteine-specific elongation factor
MSKKISRTLESTRFAGAPIVAVAAKPGGPDAPDAEGAALGVDKLIEVLNQQVFVPERSSDGAFIFSVDHCFPIRGQGTVMTGTVLTGSVAVNDVSGLV